MVKPINMLCICFVFFMVGNIGAELQQREQFNRAFECFNQLFDAGLIKVNPVNRFPAVTTYEDAIERFYRKYSDKNDFIHVQAVFFVRLENDDGTMVLEFLDYFRGKFGFNRVMDDLKIKVRNNELDRMPLLKFVTDYKETDDLEIFSRGIYDFCDEYRKGVKA